MYKESFPPKAASGGVFAGIHNWLELCRQGAQASLLAYEIA
jgi:hypothetical protein